MKRPAEQELPNWSAYLDRLGEQTKNSNAHGSETSRPTAPPPAAVQSDLQKAVEPKPGTAAGATENTAPINTRFSLGQWSYYFFAKLILFWKGAIAFHVLGNLAFAVFILIPASSRLWRKIKNALTVVLALILLYYDSWLPPVTRLFSQASLVSNFSFAYLVELISRFINLSLVGILVVAWGVFWVVSRRVRLGALVIACMAAVGLFQIFPGGKVAEKAMPDMDGIVQKFFADEAQRSISFSTPSANAVPFDVIFLHVCSLAWDDVRAVGLERHPLWKHFDILLEKFNSVASYSGPGAIHLLRATCGQQEHAHMYSPVPEKCYLMNSLLRSGFEPNLALNHDGKFDDFLGQVRMHGRLTAPALPLDGVEVAQYAFDESPIYDDLSVLNHWLAVRQKSNSQRVALYYNTISLHDGNHLFGTRASPNSLETYKARLSKLLDNMENFMQSLEMSGRRAVVVMVPEHGAAVRGDKRQIAGLREIPTPAITLVPVGIKVIGGDVQSDASTLAIDKPTSYLAISHIVNRMLQKSPFEKLQFSPSDYVVDLPVTKFVAQNENMTVTEHERHYYLRSGPKDWDEYAEFDTPVGGGVRK